MQKFLASIVCFSLCAVMATAQGEKGKGKGGVEGTWAVTGLTFDGKKLPGEILTKIMPGFSFKDGKYKTTAMGKDDEAGTYTINTKVGPAQIDLKITEGKDKGKTQLGIFKVNEDVMTLVLTKPGAKDRPKDFDGGEGIAVATLKRKK